MTSTPNNAPTLLVKENWNKPSVIGAACDRLHDTLVRNVSTGSIQIFVAAHNFCKVHSTLGCTPAVGAKLTDHNWTVEELVKEATQTADSVT